MIILPVLTTSPNTFLFKTLGEYTLNLGVKELTESTQRLLLLLYPLFVDRASNKTAISFAYFSRFSSLSPSKRSSNMGGADVREVCFD